MFIVFDTRRHGQLKGIELELHGLLLELMAVQSLFTSLRNCISSPGFCFCSRASS